MHRYGVIYDSLNTCLFFSMGGGGKGVYKSMVVYVIIKY